MRQKELIEAIKASNPKISGVDIGSVLGSFTNIVIGELSNDGEVNITGFGTFRSKIRHARRGTDPQNPGKFIDMPEVRVAKFKTGKRLKDAMKGLR